MVLQSTGQEDSRWVNRGVGAEKLCGQGVMVDGTARVKPTSISDCNNLVTECTYMLQGCRGELAE